MKTKHLFLATALVASLAACTNEEIVDVQQQNIAKSRPTVDNVELNFGVGADSRVVYEGAWKWNATDTIGALLMDVIKDSDYDVDAKWHEKYQLTQYVQTSYPFTYNEGVWSCNTKMLEGNYFFAYPWSSYDGARQVKHSLINQVQTGITADVRAKAYADNNLFIGYQQIHAGTQAADVLEDVEMWGVLGAIQLQIKNTGTQNYHINKVVLSSTNLKSTLTFDPHSAYSYAPTNDDSQVWLNDFNYANYFGWDEDPIFVKTAEEKKYNREEAILKVVNTVSNPEVDGFAQVVIEGEEDERALIANAGNTAYVMIMTNPTTITDGLKLSIYTDEGVVSDIDLTSVHVASADYKVITSAKVKEIGPNVKNTIAIQIDDNSFSVPEKMQVFNTNDLEQLIEWNAATPGAREVIAELKKDVVFTAEMLEVLEGKNNMTLTINKSVAEFVTLASDVPASVLESKQLTINSNVKVEGELELTKDVQSTAIATIEVLEGAELTINDAKAKLPTTAINNYGTLTIGDNANIKATGACEINNYGVMDVAKVAIIKTSEVNNYGELNVEGRISNIATNGDSNKNKDIKITLGEEGVITIAKNYATVESEGDLKVTENYGEVQYKGGDLNVTNKTNGKTYAALPDEVNKEALEDLGSVNVWVASGDVEFTDEENAITLANVLVEGTANITVGEDVKTVTITTLEVEGNATIEEGEITIGTVKVTEDGVFNVENDAVVKGDLISNEGLVDIDGILYSDKAAEGEGDIRGDITAYPTADPTDTPALKAKRAAYNEALRTAIMNWVNNDYITTHTHELSASSIKAADYDLNKAEKKENGVVVEKSAKTLFGEYVKAHTDRTDYWNEVDMKKVAEAYDAYKTSYTTVYGTTAAAELKITDGYALAVDTLLAEYQGNIYDESNAVVKYDAAKDEFKVLKAALEWNVNGLADGFSRIYVDTKDEKNNTITAETNALKAFQAAIVDGSVKKNTALVQKDIVMMMTLGGNYAPACSQVFKTDNVYKIFGKIEMLNDWKIKAGFTGAYNISGLTSETLKTTGWNCDVIRQWIEEARAYDITKTNACPEAVVAHNYVVADDFAVYFEAKDWKYSQDIIRAIIGDYLGFTVADITSVLP